MACLSSVEESENPPATWGDSHVESPRIWKLTSDYMRQNPQVWQSSTDPPEAVREDVEGDFAKLMSDMLKKGMHP